MNTLCLLVSTVYTAIQTYPILSSCFALHPKIKILSLRFMEKRPRQCNIVQCVCNEYTNTINVIKI